MRLRSVWAARWVSRIGHTGATWRIADKAPPRSSSGAENRIPKRRLMPTSLVALVFLLGMLVQALGQ